MGGGADNGVSDSNAIIAALIRTATTAWLPQASMSVGNAGFHNTVLTLPHGTVIPILPHKQA